MRLYQTKNIKMNKSQWVCFNCVYSESCMLELQAITPILRCEEHFTVGTDEKPFVANSKQTETTNYLGLCSSCDHKGNCSLRTENEIIINCEHYQ